MTETILDYYQQQILTSDAEIKRFEKLINTFSFLRLFSILLGGFVIYHVLQYEIIWLVELAVLLLIIIFAFLVKQQSGYEKKKAFHVALKAVNENELASISRQENIYSDGSAFENDAHNYSSDLDIFGKASLFNLANRCASPGGNEMLARWFIAPSTNEEIIQRQEAVKELGSKLDWVQHVKALLLFARKTDKKDVQDLIKYFVAPHKSAGKFLRLYILLVPYIFLSLTVLAWFVPMLSIPLVALALTNAFVVISNQHKVNTTDRILSRLGKTLAAYSEAFKKVEEESWHSDLCSRLGARLTSNSNKKFSAELKHLSVLVGRLEYRLNVFVGLFLNGIAAWDVRQLIAIEDWRMKNKELVPGAFEALAVTEALISLSSLHINNRGWCFPEIATGEGYTYIAKELAHPLIPPLNRVSNDFSLPDGHKIDIITGSNMAGKSTFLRTIGINAALAFSGAPVCATQMAVSIMNLFAYMRIRDSLNESISTFKAELNRLQSLLEVLQTEKKVYFLIDEMLRGTNSVDKYRGSKAVVEKLVSKNAVGIVATHDLQLARLEDKYPHYIRNFYFDIQVSNGEMLFDYKLKEGECKTFNASLLLKQIGIDVEVEG